MNAELLKSRTKSFSVSSVKFYCELSKSQAHQIIGRQYLRSATSVAANYRAACRGRSLKEFYAKICIVLEEADESLFWLEMFEESGLVDSAKTSELKKECEELVRLFSSTRKTLMQRLK